MGDLTVNFSRWEFACKGDNCCGHSTPVDRYFVRCLQVVRGILGEPLHINSGFRCNTHNASVPGASPASYHRLGIAADVRSDDLSLSEIEEAAERVAEFANGGIIVNHEKGYVHLDVRPNGPFRQVIGSED